MWSFYLLIYLQNLVRQQGQPRGLWKKKMGIGGKGETKEVCARQRQDCLERVAARRYKWGRKRGAWVGSSDLAIAS